MSSCFIERRVTTRKLHVVTNYGANMGRERKEEEEKYKNKTPLLEITFDRDSQ